MSSSSDDDAHRLRSASFEIVARFASASNATLLVRLTDRDPEPLDELVARLGDEPAIEDLDEDDLAVYKPMRGEAPLWDFPTGSLHRREVAAWEISRGMGWDLVPMTVLRRDGPVGPGSLQKFVAHDPGLHYFRLLEVGSDMVIDQLRRMVVFDLVIDNADRKAGHVLLIDGSRVSPGRRVGHRPAPEFPSDELPGPRTDVGPDQLVAGRVRLVDHGVSLSEDPKLRTVAWEFAGEPLPPGARDALCALAPELAGGELGERLAELLSRDELAVLVARVERLVDLQTLPGPSGARPYPWPPI